MHWKNLLPSACHTHHVNPDGTPAYAVRFDEVLKFHAPALAPVTHDGQAWHIGIDGSPAYASRFLRTFGFYEELAAVTTATGWHHIQPSGEAAYSARHQWCGNFQEGRCTVRQVDGRYAHINTFGDYTYKNRWCYAGDYRDGIAVVQDADGYSTHIDLNGKLLHGKRFRDLDVFHKRLARARDASGWMHIDIHGKPIYSDRFAAVEPFYNGQARVERFNGAISIIDEHGHMLHEPRAPIKSEFAQLSADMVGFWRTQAIATAVQVGIVDALPATTEDLAIDCRLTPDGAQRLLRGLGALSLVKCDTGVWQVTARGKYLQRDNPLTLADAALEYAGPFSQMWTQLPRALSVDSGWTAPDVFMQAAKDENRCAAHHRMLRSYARHDYPGIVKQLNLSNGDRIVDAGGGLGELSQLVLSSHPSCTVTVIDLPEVIATCQKLSPTSTIHWQPGDLFAPWDIKVDVVLLSRVLHDWDDNQALKILHRARQALTPTGRVLIIESVLRDNSFGGALCDLHLLTVTGGRERSIAHYQSLLRKAGLEPGDVHNSKMQAIVSGVLV